MWPVELLWFQCATRLWCCQLSIWALATLRLAGASHSYRSVEILLLLSAKEALLARSSGIHDLRRRRYSASHKTPAMVFPSSIVSDRIIFSACGSGTNFHVINSSASGCDGPGVKPRAR